MLHLSQCDLPFAVPVPVAAAEGGLVTTWEHDGQRLDARLVTFVDGDPLADFPYLAPSVVTATARLAAQCAHALADFDHPGLDRLLQWDCRHAADVVEALLPAVPDPALQRSIEAATAQATAALDPVTDDLRVAVVHADVTDVNVVALRDLAGRPRPCGLIDFGDISRTWIVSDPAVTATSLIAHDPARPVQTTMAVAKGFHDVLALTSAEIDALWPLVVARAAACVVSSEQQAALDPDNRYAVESAALDRLVFEAVAAVPLMLGIEASRSALGRPATVRVLPSPSIPLIDGLGSYRVADGSPTSVTAMPPGEANVQDAPQRCVQPHAMAHLSHTALDTSGESPTIATGLQIFASGGQDLVAPCDCTVVDTDPLTLAIVADVRIVVKGGDITTSPGSVSAGTVLGTTHETPLAVHVETAPLSPPDYCIPSLAPAWLRLCPDPAPWVGAPTYRRHSSAESLIGRRDAVLATTQEHYYEQPPRIERGWRHHLFDMDAQAYLDVVNNIASVGHSHPRVTEAVSHQLRLLNTNSRFNYASIVDFSEALAALLPEHLDTVFLVNTGSEALDLALRIAGAATGGTDVLALQGAYHGWTSAADAISSSVADNPHALTTRPSWVQLVESPNTYRGRHRGADAASCYAADVQRAVTRVQQSGRVVSAFVAESLFGNAGGVELPPGYLAQAYATVRAAGGVCIADEVQVGYARTGESFWAFEREGVLPDIVCVAKAAGNGMALGAVVTTQDLADQFRSEGSFFSSVGGSPVSCAAGLAVLQVIQEEDLQGNALKIGGQLKSQLGELASRHQIIGTVHGRGLYLGVELVRDRESLEPATEETAAICERMLGEGVIVQPTADFLNVLKVKPPLCLTPHSADFFVDALDRVLGTGW